MKKSLMLKISAAMGNGILEHMTGVCKKVFVPFIFCSTFPKDREIHLLC